MARGLARKGFDLDLADGQEREAAFADLLADWKNIEHKRDYWGEITGSVAVEYETSSQPRGQGIRRKSGIAVTTSAWWCIEYLDEHRIFVPTATVKALAREAIDRKAHRWIGDDDRFHNALVPRAWFFDVPRIQRVRPELRPSPEAMQTSLLGGADG